jgi:GNAT superfamily N-acetyltransferase
VNVPLPPYTGESAWYPIVESYLPALAAAFGPDLIVSQHGADSHGWDPLAHLHVTTTAHGKAARLIDALAHQFGGGRWLATGGGGYDAYRVVPRTWALTWLAGAHREVPSATPEAWRARWADEAARYGQAPLPERFDDEPNAGIPYDLTQEASEQRALALAAIHRSVVLPRLLQVAIEKGWWSPLASAEAQPVSAADATGEPTIMPTVDAETWSRLTLLPRVIAPADPVLGHRLVAAALRDGGSAIVSAAVAGSDVVGLAVSAPADPTDGTRELLALGVAPDHRRRGIATALLKVHALSGSFAVVTLAERDPIDPLPRQVRADIARRLLGGAGLEISGADNAVRSIDPAAMTARKR